jgi:hypothetical protein
MSRLDVLKSLLRSGARSVEAGLRGSALSASLRRALSEIGFRHTAIADAALTRAVGRLPGVAAATVSCAHGRMRVEASYGSGERLAFALEPAGVTFAAGGAKELAFTVEPRALAGDLRSLDVCAAISAEIARGLWRPALTRAPRSDSGASVSHENASLIVDLRSVPEVRWALRQTLPSLLIEAIGLRSLAIEPGRLMLELSLDRLG